MDQFWYLKYPNFLFPFLPYSLHYLQLNRLFAIIEIYITVIFYQILIYGSSQTKETIFQLFVWKIVFLVMRSEHYSQHNDSSDAYIDADVDDHLMVMWLRSWWWCGSFLFAFNFAFHQTHSETMHFDYRDILQILLQILINCLTSIVK